MVPNIFEVWICDRDDGCVAGKHDMMCYTFHEPTHFFLPLDLNSNLRFVRSSGMRCYSADGKDVMQCDQDVSHCVTYLALHSGHFIARYASASRKFAWIESQ
jgi:hypothetical protein